MRTALVSRLLGRAGRPNRLRERGDTGFTLVEMLVALALMAIVMVTLAPAFYTEMKASSLTDYRSTATGLATGALEQMRAFPYYEIGWNSSDYSAGSTSQAQNCVSSGTPLSWDSYSGSTAVQLTSDSIFDNALNNLATTQTVSPITYRIYRCVYWMDASTATGTTNTSAYKLVWVGISWTAYNTTWHVSQTSAIYPGGEGAWASPGQNNDSPTSSTCSNSGSVPHTPTVTATANGTSEVDLTWTEAANPTSENPIKYLVNYGTSSSGPWTPYSDNALLSENVTGLAAGFTYNFQVFAVACDGTSSPGSTVVSATTQNGPQACSYSNFTVTPKSTATIGSNQRLSNISSFQISVQVTSGCNDISVSYSPQNDGNYTVDYANAGSGSLTWNTTASKWVAGTITFNLQIGGASVGTPYQVQITCSAKNC